MIGRARLASVLGCVAWLVVACSGDERAPEGSAGAPPAEATPGPIDEALEGPADVEVELGADAVLTARAPSAASLQWLKDGAPISGATAATLTLPKVTFRDRGAYAVEATFASGAKKTASARLFVTGIAPLAGPSGGAAFADGAGAEARLAFPNGIARDAEGNVFVADWGNKVIRKITQAGEVSTFAGKPGEEGTADGVGDAARFSDPTGLAIDAAGNLYVSEMNHTIRKITPAREVTTLAGSPGESGAADGKGASARFKYPRSLVVLGQNLYVADTENCAIRKVTPTGEVTTFSGVAGSCGNVDGSATTARFGNVFQVAIHPFGTMYVGDFNGRIRLVAPDGSASTLKDPAQHPVVIAYPQALAYTGGTIYVSGYDNCVRAIPQDGSSITPFAGTCGKRGTEDGAPGVAGIDVSALLPLPGGGLLASDSGSTIRTIAANGDVTTWIGRAAPRGAGDGPAASATFSDLRGNGAVDALGNVYVADRGTHTIRKIAADGAVSGFAGRRGVSGAQDGPAGQATFNNPEGVAFDPAGNLLVTDTTNHKIRKISPDGVVSTLAGSGAAGSEDGPSATASFKKPMGIVVAPDGVIFVSDSGNETIRRIAPDGEVSTFAGAAGQTGATDGVGASATFDYPRALVRDALGNLLVAAGATIRKIDPQGKVTTVAGTWNAYGHVDGTGAAARIGDVKSMALEDDGTVVLADSDSSTLRRLRPDGTVTTVAGKARWAAVMPGALPGALLYPSTIARLPNGTFAVAADGSRVLEVGLPK